MLQKILDGEDQREPTRTLLPAPDQSEAEAPAKEEIEIHSGDQLCEGEETQGAIDKASKGEGEKGSE